MIMNTTERADYNRQCIVRAIMNDEGISFAEAEQKERKQFDRALTNALNGKRHIRKSA